MTYGLDNDEINLRLQQREREQSQIFQICEILASLTTRKELNDSVNNIIKNTIGFHQMMVFIEDKTQKGYSLYYHNDLLNYIKYKNDRYSNNSEIFMAAFNAPEPIIFSKNELKKSFKIPLCISESFQSTIINTVSCAISSKYYNGVVVFGFGKETIPKRSDLYAIKIVSRQLGITLTNILALEKIIPISAESEAYRVVPLNEIADQMGIIGNSTSIAKVRSLISLVSTADTSVLIQGESGTGKELIARAVHNNSERSKKAFIKVNCAAIPENLIESELFGHEKGSFTGAVTQKTGKFEQAHLGTLFLDDVSEMPLEMQVKLLRALQEKEIQRIGSNKNTIVDIRIIAATNKDLQEEVQKGKFRGDLFYRLNVFPIDVPPLRERTDDIPILVNFFLKHYAAKNKKPLKTITAKVLNILKIYDWPGNVRELENIIERAILLSSEKVIKEIKINSFKENSILSGMNFIKPWKEFEKEYILSVLKFCKGKVSGPNGAASLLEIPSTTLNSKIEKLGIKKRHYL
jgi:formate hydrogenlyase transcriptional activator